MAKTKFSIEGAFEQLEDIIEQLSSEEISLSDSMDLYKKGVKILDKCSQTLDKTQKEIITLQEGQNDAIHKGTAFEED
uniref:exodeoxyribonuclease VII small subunit n=1 Tax=Anaerobutyricum hallii TaxID=39488 RepID=UPI003FF0316E